jgi:ABC-type oligopeptide transport system ATPase subunit
MTVTTRELDMMSMQELSKLNREVVAMIKHKQSMNNRTAIFSFNRGDLVKFTSNRSGITMRGEVMEVKRTKVTVKTPQGSYLVPASMLVKGV